MKLQADGNYRVRKGDTLHAIAFRFGLDHRDIARWNGIGPPYTIYPDQVLSMSPPPTRTAQGSAAPRSQAPPSALPKPAARPSQPSTTGSRPAPNPAASATPDNVTWGWPAEGRLLRGFVPNDPSRNGLDIAGRAGQDIRASAAGTVVYSGNGLIGYGELIIIKHNERLLSAYAHNRVRLVEEGERVTAGQKIAEMGRNDRNEAMLHFEVRSDGRPVNPLEYLPRR